tara:strand:- start:869 stop:1474 length:606 start_codon:yes stop_codon:yes gene_type:complete
MLNKSKVQKWLHTFANIVTKNKYRTGNAKFHDLTDTLQLCNKIQEEQLYLLMVRHGFIDDSKLYDCSLDEILLFAEEAQIKCIQAEKSSISYDLEQAYLQLPFVKGGDLVWRNYYDTRPHYGLGVVCIDPVNGTKYAKFDGEGIPPHFSKFDYTMLTHHKINYENELHLFERVHLDCDPDSLVDFWKFYKNLEIIKITSKV